MEEMIRVVLADAHPLVRARLRAVLDETTDIRLMGATASTDTLPHLCDEKQADVLLLDATMTGAGLDATLAAMRRKCPQVKVVVLSAVENPRVVQRAARLGAVGYMLKEECPILLARAIHSVMGGTAWYSTSVSGEMAVRVTVESVSVADLTERELQVLRGIVRGWPTLKIADRFNLSEQTVRSYTDYLYNKIGVDSRATATRWATQQGLDGATPMPEA